MNEKQLIAALNDSAANPAQHERTLKSCAEYLEESYILNLPISASLKKALEAFAARKGTAAPLAKRARTLLRKYAK